MQRLIHIIGIMHSNHEYHKIVTHRQGHGNWSVDDSATASEQSDAFCSKVTQA